MRDLADGSGLEVTGEHNPVDGWWTSDGVARTVNGTIDTLDQARGLPLATQLRRERDAADERHAVDGPVGVTRWPERPSGRRRDVHICRPKSGQPPCLKGGPDYLFNRSQCVWVEQVARLKPVGQVTIWIGLSSKPEKQLQPSCPTSANVSAWAAPRWYTPRDAGTLTESVCRDPSHTG